MKKLDDTKKKEIAKCLLIGGCVLFIFAGAVMLKYGSQLFCLFGFDALPLVFLGCGIIAILEGVIGIVKLK